MFVSTYSLPDPKFSCYALFEVDYTRNNYSKSKDINYIASEQHKDVHQEHIGIGFRWSSVC